MTPVATDRAHAFTDAVAVDRLPYKLADLSLAEFGRKEIRLAQQEMPGLMALRREYEGHRPLAGAWRWLWPIQHHAAYVRTTLLGYRR